MIILFSRDWDNDPHWLRSFIGLKPPTMKSWCINIQVHCSCFCCWWNLECCSEALFLRCAYHFINEHSRPNTKLRTSQNWSVWKWRVSFFFLWRISLKWSFKRVTWWFNYIYNKPSEQVCVCVWPHRFLGYYTIVLSGSDPGTMESYSDLIRYGYEVLTSCQAPKLHGYTFKTIYIHLPRPYIV